MNTSQPLETQSAELQQLAPQMPLRHTDESSPSFVQRHSLLLKAGAFGVAAYMGVGALHGFINGFPGNNHDHGHIAADVKHVAPLDLDCMGIMTAGVNGHIRSKLFGLFGGFSADITTETESLLCINKDGVVIDEKADGTTDITIDATRSAVIFTRMREDKRVQNADNANGISGFGDGIADQLGALNLPSYKKHDKQEQAALARELAVRMVNTVDENCAKQLWLPVGAGSVDPKVASLLMPDSVGMDETVIHKIYERAYGQDVSRAGRDASKLHLVIEGVPAFKATYKSNYDSGVYKITKFDKQADCIVPEAALDFKIDDLKHQADAK